MAAKKTSKKQSKAAFIRSLPASLSVKEVVAKAKAAGITIPETYVYWARSSAKGATKGKATKGGTRSTARKAPSVSRPIATRSSAEDLLRAVGAELGLARAIEILQGERARVHAVLRG